MMHKRGGKKKKKRYIPQDTEDETQTINPKKETYP